MIISSANLTTGQDRPRSPSITHVTTHGDARSRNYEARLAVSPQTRHDAYRVRYHSYFSSGYIAANPAGMFSDRFDDQPNALTVVLYENARPVASVRVCLLTRGTDFTSPARETFTDEVDQALAADADDAFGGRGLEINRLVRTPDAANNHGLVFLLYRMAGYIALAKHTHTYFACVRPNHAPFYRRLGYELAAPPKPYPGLKCDMQLMMSDRIRYDRIRAAVPMMDPFTGTTGSLAGFFEGAPVSLRLTD